MQLKLNVKRFIFVATIVFSSANLASAECEIRHIVDFDSLSLGWESIEFERVARYVTEPLVVLHNDSKTVSSGLAERWEYNPENSSFTFFLSNKCGWSDGVPVTAKDVVFGMQQHFRSSTIRPITEIVRNHLSIVRGASAIIAGKAPIESLGVEAIADNVVRIYIEGSPQYALNTISIGFFDILPSHIPGSSQLDIFSPRNVFNGAFKIVSADYSKIVAERNPHYCKQDKYNIDRAIFYAKKSSNHELSEFLAGRLDVIRDVSEKQLQSIVNKFPKDQKPRLVRNHGSLRKVFLLANLEHEVLRNSDIRAALIDALDIASLINYSSQSAYLRSESLFAGSPDYHNFKYPRYASTYKQGVERLQEVMRKHGYSESNRLDISIRTWPLPRFETDAKHIASMLRPAYFDVNFIREHSISGMINKIQAHQYDLAIASYTSEFEHPKGGWHMYKSLVFNEDRLHTWAELTDLGEPVSRLKELDDKVAISADSADTYEILYEMEKILSENHFIHPLYEGYLPVLISADIEIDEEFNASHLNIKKRSSCE